MTVVRKEFDVKTHSFEWAGEKMSFET